MVGSPSNTSKTRRWHRLLEHYTPDGMLGRLILATCTGTVSFLAFVVVAATLNSFGLLEFFIAPLAATVGLTTALLTVVTLWPVYLSLIGNVESSKSYMKPKSASFDAGATQSATTGMHTDTSLSNDRSDGAVDNLKRQYAAGNLSEEELDQRVENLLHVDEVASQAKEKRRRKESTGVSRQRERN